MAKWNVEKLPETLQVKEGYAYIRYQGQSYRVKLGEFKLHARSDATEISCFGILDQ